MDFRDWLTILGLIIISGLTIDILRRLWKQHCLNNNLVLDLEKIKGLQEEYLDELPYGGARIKKTDNSEYQVQSSNYLNHHPAFKVIIPETEKIEKKYADSKKIANQSFDIKTSSSVVPSQSFIIIHLEAMKGYLFSGDQVLQIFLDNSLRLDEKKIFRYKRKANNTLFSVVNGKKPGIFNLKTMRSETFSILTFFMIFPGPENPLHAFKTMINTIDIISRELYAEVKNEQHCPMTKKMLDYYYKRVLEFQRIKQSS